MKNKTPITARPNVQYELKDGKVIEKNYFDSGEKEIRTKPRKLLKHCIVCNKKKNLIFYHSTNEFIIQICNKCLEDSA